MTRHPSKVDWWLGVLIAAVPVGSVLAAVALHLSGDHGGALVAWVSLAAIGALYVGVVWPVAYELHDEALVVRFGIIRSRVPYASIREVRPSRSVLASPALSLDRLAIDTGTRPALTISPVDRDRFLGDLAARATHLVRDADRLATR